tara:strand:- start:91 stop:645 length:555 start_codon:yes stop_codon:yes gene_type:complete
MARQFITGDAELERTLSKLSDKGADRVARSALGAGVAVMRSAIKKAAPVGATGTLKKNIGSRLQKAKRGRPVVAKAGVNVGKKKKTAASLEGRGKRAPHAHLVALGTKPRARFRRVGGLFNIPFPTPAQGNTGTMPKNEFVRLAVVQSRNRMLSKMKQRAAKKLKEEVAKATGGKSYASAKGRG